MADLVIEIVRAIVVGLILFGLIRNQQSIKDLSLKGWREFLYGFILIFFGTLIDITDNFESLNSFILIGDTPVQAFLEKVIGYLLGYLLIFIGVWRWLPIIIEHNRVITENLKVAKEEVNTLKGFFPICASCKNIRDDKGYWNQVESYISSHSEAVFSHSICPKCLEKLYPELYPSTEPKP